MKNIITLSALAFIATNMVQAAGLQSDAREAAESTTKTEYIKYRCQNGKHLSVKYGFNSQQQPTYAQAKLNGKSRFMPINVHTSDATGTTFGDEHNFSLYGDPITFKAVKTAEINIQSPAAEILYKDCKPKKR